MIAVITSQRTTRSGLDKYEHLIDKANRLTKEESSVAREDGSKDAFVVEYSYDSVGNHTKKVEDGTGTEYTYNELNRLQSETTEGKETISYAYDTNGNLLCRGTTTEYETYTYTGANMLESVTSTTKTGETKETYEYDAEGNRLSKTESKAVKEVDETTGEVTTTWEETDKIYYVMDTSGSYAQVIAELDADKNVKVLYTRGDGIISREEKSETGESSYNFYLSDGHGDVRQLTDETGAVTDNYRYNSYGELEETQGETENPYLYTGEYYDEGTGLYYLRARYMNPETGTFTSMDTYRGNAYDPASLHRYTYAQNNPQMYNDPSGHMGLLIGTLYRNQYNIQIMGWVNATMNCIINELFGGKDKQDPMVAFLIGYATGVGCAAAYYAATVVKALSVIMTAIEVLSLSMEIIECAVNVILAIVYGVTGNYTQMAIYIGFATLCLVDILIQFGAKGKVAADGPKGSKEFCVDGKHGLGELSDLDELLEEPNKLVGISGEELYDYLIDKGHDVKPLSKGSLAGIPFEEGGGFKVNWGGDRILQFHPAHKSHHGGAYFKISSGETGKIRIDLYGILIE